MQIEQGRFIDPLNAFMCLSKYVSQFRYVVNSFGICDTTAQLNWIYMQNVNAFLHAVPLDPNSLFPIRMTEKSISVMIKSLMY